MKVAKNLFVAVLVIASVVGQAQNLKTRTNDFEIDMNTMTGDADIPQIAWIEPIPEINFSQAGRMKINAAVTGNTALKSVTINIIDTQAGKSKGKQTLVPDETQLYSFMVDKNLFLVNGSMEIELIAENVAGVKTMTSKKVYVGDEAIASVSTLQRKDFALIFATDEYEHWGDLVNPIYDSRTIAEKLDSDYDFEVEVIENATQSEILGKLREYSQKTYQPMDQLFIFFAGHGSYDQTFGEGFVVTTESLLRDEGKTSYLSHNRLRSIINNIPSEHIFLTMDVCFGGTFDEALASARGMEDVYREQQRSEYISKKLISKTRIYLTSGGKTYVSDGIKGQHSPFAKKFIEALDSKGGEDGILTTQEIFGKVEKLQITPRMGAFGSNAPNSDFLFIVK